jgi:hypothetical protein
MNKTTRIKLAEVLDAQSDVLRALADDLRANGAVAEAIREEQATAGAKPAKRRDEKPLDEVATEKVASKADLAGDAANALTSYVEAHGVAAARAKLQEFGVERLKQLDKEKLPDFIKALEQTQ